MAMTSAWWTTRSMRATAQGGLDPNGVVSQREGTSGRDAVRGTAVKAGPPAPAQATGGQHDARTDVAPVDDARSGRRLAGKPRLGGGVRRGHFYQDQHHRRTGAQP